MSVMAVQVFNQAKDVCQLKWLCMTQRRLKASN